MSYYKEVIKIFAKYIDKNTIIRCPRNGYIGSKGISNLDIFFEDNPDEAKKAGYLKFYPCTEPVPEDAYEEYTYEYILENNEILERMIKIDNTEATDSY